MAEIVLGLASSHTPQMSTSAEFWKEHAARDERNTQLLGRDGRYHSYDDLLANADPGLAGELEATADSTGDSASRCPGRKFQIIIRNGGWRLSAGHR